MATFLKWFISAYPLCYPTGGEAIHAVVTRTCGVCFGAPVGAGGCLWVVLLFWARSGAVAGRVHWVVCGWGVFGGKRHFWKMTKKVSLKIGPWVAGGCGRRLPRVRELEHAQGLSSGHVRPSPQSSSAAVTRESVYYIFIRSIGQVDHLDQLCKIRL